MTFTARAASDAITPSTRQVSPFLTASAVAFVALGIVSGLVKYLHRSPARAVHVAGTSAWTQHLILAGVAAVLYGFGLWWHARRPSRGNGTLILLAPFGRSAATRLTATLRQASWRSLAVLPFLSMFAYCLWRTGEQVTGGLDPNFTANAWGGPSYPGAMFCHYLDGGLIMAACAKLLNWIMIPSSETR
jgi:hypothetical protein